MAIVQPAGVAGMFYPSEAESLRTQVQGFLDEVPLEQETPPKALIAPHAGYRFSGPVAAQAYARILPIAEKIKRVVLMGPAHRVALSGIAVSSATLFQTPLGDIPVDRAGIDSSLSLARQGVAIGRQDRAFSGEHSLEVHFPFLQVILGDFQLLPFVVGKTPAVQTALVLEHLWGGEETLIVISSDLSHFHDHATAQGLDAVTTASILALDGEAIDGNGACGVYPVRGLLHRAKMQGMQGEALDVRNSFDTAQMDPSRVVGYGSYAFREPQAHIAKRGSPDVV